MDFDLNPAVAERYGKKGKALGNLNHEWKDRLPVPLQEWRAYLARVIRLITMVACGSLPCNLPPGVYSTVPTAQQVVE